MTVQNGSTVTMHAARTVAGATTINTGCILGTAGATFTANGAVAVNGSFQINQSGWATGSGAWTYGSAGTLIFNNSSGSYGVNSDVWWPTSSGPVNVNVLGAGGMTLNVTRTVTGTIQSSSAIGNANNLTIGSTGTLQLNGGSYVDQPPVYSSGSTLKYNVNAVYGRYKEWQSTSPTNVQLSNTTTLNYGNTDVSSHVPANTAAQTISGNLTIDAASSLYMDYNAPNADIGVLSVGGALILNGNLSLGNRAGGDLHVAGNWTRTGVLTTNGRAVEFNGSSLQTLTGVTTFDYLTLSNAAGLSLNNKVYINTNLTINSGAGDITTNSDTVSLGSSATLTEPAGKFIVGKVTTTRTVSQSSNNTFGGIGVEINAAGAAPSSTAVTRTTGTALAGNGHNSIKRYFDISPATNTALNATLVFHYDDRTSELNSISESNLVTFKSTDNGSTWSLGAGNVNTTANTVTLSGISDFSRWTLGDNIAPLPVELTTFSASARERQVILKWETATEVNSSKFIVERSKNSDWTKIGEIAAAGKSNAPKSYSFIDKSLNTGKYSYRLKMIDNDGTYKYSSEAESEIGIPTEFSLSQNYPNPFNPSTTINYDLPTDAQLKIELFSVTGSQIATMISEVQKAGYNNFILNMNYYNLPSGTYFYKISGSEIGSGKSFSSVKKMIYLK